MNKSAMRRMECMVNQEEDGAECQVKDEAVHQEEDRAVHQAKE
jgi:hypothetical protein